MCVDICGESFEKIQTVLPFNLPDLFGWLFGILPYLELYLSHFKLGIPKRVT